MRINEVEQLVGITKRNIRFYEAEGLLNPQRSSENGYRDYSEADVAVLKQIKLFRKLNVPMEEIRRIQQGMLTVEDAMGRHIIQLERERTNLAAMSALCAGLAADRPQLSSMDTDRYLQQMESLEQEGTRFMNIKKKDAPAKYVAPVIAALVMALLMAGLIALMVWAYVTEPEGAPPLALMIFLLAIPAVIILGVFIALVQRIKQIKGGEEDAAAQY